MIPSDTVAVIVGESMMKTMITFSAGQNRAEPIVRCADRLVVGLRAEGMREGVNEKGDMKNDK